MFLNLKIMDFKNVALTKNCSYLCDRRHECIIYMTKNQILVKMYIYLTNNVKLDIPNTNFEVTNQHRNGMCLQSLEKNFYLNAPSSFDFIFTQYNMGVKLYFYSLHPKIKSYYNSTQSLKNKILVFINKTNKQIKLYSNKKMNKKSHVFTPWYYLDDIELFFLNLNISLFELKAKYAKNVM
jgi:hypothetical protein